MPDEVIPETALDTKFNIYAFIIFNLQVSEFEEKYQNIIFFQTIRANTWCCTCFFILIEEYILLLILDCRESANYTCSITGNTSILHLRKYLYTKITILNQNAFKQ